MKVNKYTTPKSNDTIALTLPSGKLEITFEDGPPTTLTSEPQDSWKDKTTPKNNSNSYSKDYRYVCGLTIPNELSLIGPFTLPTILQTLDTYSHIENRILLLSKDRRAVIDSKRIKEVPLPTDTSLNVSFRRRKVAPTIISRVFPNSVVDGRLAVDDSIVGLVVPHKGKTVKGEGVHFYDGKDLNSAMMLKALQGTKMVEGRILVVTPDDMKRKTARRKFKLFADDNSPDSLMDMLLGVCCCAVVGSVCCVVMEEIDLDLDI